MQVTAKVSNEFLIINHSSGGYGPLNQLIMGVIND